MPKLGVPSPPYDTKSDVSLALPHMFTVLTHYACCRFHVGRALEVAVMNGDMKALPEAKTHFSEAVRLQPKDCEFRCCLARVLSASGEHHAAAEQWAVACKLAGPADVELQRKHAAAIEAAGSVEKALQVLRQAEKNDPRDFRTVRCACNHHFTRSSNVVA